MIENNASSTGSGSATEPEHSDERQTLLEIDHGSVSAASMCNVGGLLWYNTIRYQTDFSRFNVEI